jgi:hypothetical protein
MVMKKIIFFLITGLFALQINCIYSQTEFAPIGAEWYYSEPNAGYTSDSDYDYQKYISEKDTIIDGKTCRLITNRFYPAEIIYEENGSIYYYYLNDFRKIFDFTLNIGDTIDFEFKCNTLKSMILGDTVVLLQCVVESITTETIAEKEIRTFRTVFLENEELDYLILPSSYDYSEIFGQTFIRYNEFIPVLTGLAEVAIFGYRTMRCYHDNEIDYIANWWVEKDKPCDEPFSLSVKDYEKNNLHVFPNPAKNELTIQLSENFNTEQIRITIYDNVGKLVFEKENSSEQIININIQNFSSGYYFVKINNKNNIVLTDKFVKL